MRAAPLRYAWRAMKKHRIKTCLAVILVANALLIAVVVWCLPSQAVPSFQFLAGQSPLKVVQDQNTGWDRLSQKLYSFAGDFENVCTAAQAELSALGYTQVPQYPGQLFVTREYRLYRRSSDETITVRIMADAKLTVLSTPKNSQYASPDRYDYRRQAGWLAVEVDRRGSQAPLWEGVASGANRLFRRVGLKGT